MRYKAVLFDLDGTVMNTIDDLNDSVNYTLKHFGMPEISLRDTMRFIGKESLGELEHVVRIATLRAIGHSDVMMAIRVLYEVLVDAVSS